MRRRFLILFAAVLAAGLLLIATMPWWLGVALRTAPQKWGVTFARYERIGYTRFALHDVEFRRGGVRVTATRAEADTPLLWLWRHWRKTSRPVVAERWLVEVTPTAAPASATPAPSSVNGWMPLRSRLQRIAVQLDRWLPQASTGAGTVRWKNGELSLASASWAGRTLKINGLIFKALKTDATVSFSKGSDDIRIEARIADTTDTLILRSHAEGVAGELTWWEQRASLTGGFGASGWLPAEAAVVAEAWNVPAAKVKLGNLYSTVRGRGRVDWSAGHFRADVAATGEPLADKKAPPLEVTLRGQGDPAAFTLETLHAMLPGVAAELSEAVTIERSGKLRESAARFTVQVDLAKQPWFEAEGAVTGEARLVSGLTSAPVVEFRLNAQQITAQGLSVAATEANGRFDWPRVQLERVSLAGREGGQLVGRGGWDFQKKELLAAHVAGEIRRATLARWLPRQPEFAAVTIAADASGPLADIVHAGEAKAEAVTFPGVKPVQTVLTWNGRGRVVEKFSLRAQAEATRLKLAGAVETDAIRLSALELAQNEKTRLRLVQPATISWRPTLRIDSLNLTGDEAALDANATWGVTGKALLGLKNFSSDWLKDLVTLPGPAWQVRSLAVTAEWDRGPMNFSAVLGAAIALGEGRRANVNLASRGDAHGVRLEALRAAEGADSIVNATGLVPVVFTPGATPLMKIDLDAPLVLDAETAPNAAFWQELEALTGFQLKEPSVAVHVNGTWRKPAGDVRLQVAKIAIDSKRFKRPLPSVEALDVALTADHDSLRLGTFTLKVEGQNLRASGRLPMGETDWTKIFKEPLAFARRGADVTVEIPDADLGAFARVLPAALAPKGRVHLDMTYRGGALGGNLRLRDAATRPLGPLGVVQEIEADVGLAGHALELRTVTAKSGGEVVQLSGRVELPMLELAADAKPAPSKEPRFDVALKGNNLPFVRRTGLLVRGDLDLKLNTAESGLTRLSGKVRLRDSLFLQDVRGLLPGGAQSKSRRPPYFAIETPPLDAWRLDVEVDGGEFMRLRTPLFNGIASASFHLGGTLGEPVALGEATIDEGNVRMPFASFGVQEGRVMLTSENPYTPQIWLAATARRFSYDLRMEITGPASAPVLTFSSSPPLDHGQILLMVMAGEAPKSEVTITEQQRATQLGRFLGQSLLASFGDSEGADRLSISTGEKVSRQGRETYDIEYRLNNRWSITGAFDEFDEYNAGVKWRVYSKGGHEDKVTHENAQK